MTKPIFDYVLSAPTFGVFPNILLERIPKEKVKEAINAYAHIANGIISKNCINFTPETSIMYNAFTEKEKLKFFKYYGQCDFKHVYSDSGGLQMVTRNCEITNKIKDEIYETQTYADYALCFDVIKLSRLTREQHRNERSQDSNKVFEEYEHKEAGFITGQNIKRQIQKFKDLNAKTKVLIIVQGNNKDDMVAFYNEIEKQLVDEDYDYVGGFALADTCIGHGQIELVEMLRAAREISRNCHENVYKQIHLLGVGSLPRLAPAIYLKKSNYIDKTNYISYDSSKISQSFIVGAAILDSKIVRLGSRKNHISTNHFSNVYDMFSDFLSSKGITKDKYLEIVFDDNSDNWSNAKITHWAKNTKDEWRIALSYVYKTAHIFYCLTNFHKCLDGMLDNSFKLKKEYYYLESLQNVTDEKDMIEWLEHQKQTKKTKSKRIRRREDIKSLEGLFS